MVCLPAIALTPQLASGAVKILAVSTAARSALLPGIPTLRESGIDVEADAWNGVIAPAGTPAAIVAKIARGFAGHHGGGHPRHARYAIDGADPGNAGAIPRPDRSRPRSLGPGYPGREYPG
jgi:hypothetical protein